VNQLPGPDPGVCPDCGGWRRAGTSHDCDVERARQVADAERLANLLRLGDVPVKDIDAALAWRLADPNWCNRR